MKGPALRLAAVLLLLAFVVSPSTVAQCLGNPGQPALRQTACAVGADHTTTLVGLPGETYVLAVSDGLRIQTLPGLGTVCIDLGSPVFAIFASGLIPASGSVTFTGFVPDTPFWRSLVFFAQGAVTDPVQPAGVTITRVLRKDFEPIDSFTTVAPPAMIALSTSVAHIDGLDLVLVSGGHAGSSNPGFVHAATSLYSPILRAFFAGPTMSSPRFLHSSTTMADGRVLLAGGVASVGGSPLTICEIFDPANFSMQPVASMNTARSDHRAVLLDDGRVLVVGGTGVTGSLASAELYDPLANTWTPAGNGLPSPRTGHTLTRLPNGRVLVTGGWMGFVSNIFGIPVHVPTPECSLFDPATGLFSVAPLLPEARAEHGASVLQNGHVLVSGGNLVVASPLGTINPPASSTRVFNGTGWTMGPELPQPMEGPITQIGLPGDRVWVAPGLLAPGIGSTSTLAPAIIDPAAVSAIPAAAPPIAISTYGAARLDEGTILICAGNPYAPAALLYTP